MRVWAASAPCAATLASAPLPACQAVKASSEADAAAYLAGTRRTTSVHSRRCASTPR
jgi:hypothetical protein